MATGTISRDLDIENTIVSGTTDTNGNLTLDSTAWNASKRTILAAQSGGYRLTPYINTSSIWCLHVEYAAGGIPSSVDLNARAYYITRS